MDRDTFLDELLHLLAMFAAHYFGAASSAEKAAYGEEVLIEIFDGMDALTVLQNLRRTFPNDTCLALAENILEQLDNESDSTERVRTILIQPSAPQIVRRIADLVLLHLSVRPG